MAKAVSDSMSFAQGYPLEIIQGPVDQKYQCSSCRLLLRDPIQSFCGHRFCKICIERLISPPTAAIVKCPSCVAEDAENEFSILQLDQTFPDNAIKREFASLKVKCVNQGQDVQCDWAGTFKEYEHHEKICPFRCIVCECGARVPEKCLLQHQQTECPKRSVECSYCGTSVIFQELESHHQVCPKVPVTCRCGSQKLREQMEQHLDPMHGDCERRSIKCPYGCEDDLDLESLSDHMNRNAANHLEILRNKGDSLSQGLSDGSTVLGNGSLNTTVAEVVSTLDSMIKKVREIEQVVQGGNGAAAMPTNLTSDGAQSNASLAAIDTRISTFEGVLSVLNREIERVATVVQQQESDRRERVEALENKIKNLDRQLALKDVAMAEQDLRLIALERTAYDGVLLWKLTDIKRKRQEAMSGQVTSIYSPSFFTSKNGYKMCARIYLNGDGMGKGTHISLFFVIMRGYADALIRWPFRQKVTLMLLDQNNREHVVDAFRPDPNSSSFKRPSSDMNIASGCPLFMPLTQLESPQHAYLKEDTIFIKVVVDCGDLN